MDNDKATPKESINQDTHDGEEHLPRLENWYQYGTRLHGNVYGRPPFPDGEMIYTSRVLWRTYNRCQTQNTLYVLGVPLRT